MLTHKQIWSAVDELAARHDLTVSGLARRAGLDPTTFNKSKRLTPEGKKRWPNTDSISKILAATGEDIDDFFSPAGFPGGARRNRLRGIPLIGLAEAGDGSYFDDAGFPVGDSWDEVHVVEPDDDDIYALEINGDSMLPLYSDGDIILVSPSAGPRRGDKVVVKTSSGEVMAKILHRKTARILELKSLNSDQSDRTFQLKDISWIARILWVSQ